MGKQINIFRATVITCCKREIIKTDVTVPFEKGVEPFRRKLKASKNADNVLLDYNIIENENESKED